MYIDTTAWAGTVWQVCDLTTEIILYTIFTGSLAMVDKNLNALTGSGLLINCSHYQGPLLVLNSDADDAPIGY